jgi:hypothetical protein
MLLVSCSRDPEPARVQYPDQLTEPPPGETVTKAVLPVFDQAEVESGRAPVAVDCGVVEEGHWTTFEGVIRLQDKQKSPPFAVLYLAFTGKNGTPVIAGAGHAWSVAEGDDFRYRISIQAPERAGEYEILLRPRFDPARPRKQIALGKIVVK